MKNAIVVLLSLISYTVSVAQVFTGEATLPKVEKDGFYRIPLTPELTKYLTDDFSNIRIYNSANAEVPYVLETESPRYFTEEFKEYEIIEKRQIKNCCTSLVLRNPEGNSINNIVLSIRNAAITKNATLLGSDNQQDWFALKESFSISSIYNESKTSEIKIVDFPLSNYTYYNLQFDDSTSAPLNIVKAGYFKTSTEDGKFTEILNRTVQSDSLKEKRTFITISLDTTYHVDRLLLAMQGPAYFLRYASLSVKKQRLNKKKEVEFIFEPILGFEISSKQPSILEFTGMRTSELLIEIDNRDNPSLQVASVNALQLNRYLTAWLKADDVYRLKLGNAEMQQPNYDLVFFKDKIPADPIVLTAGKVTLYEQKKSTTTLFTSRAIIWIAIGAIAVVLAVMSIRLINETTIKKE